MLRRSSLQLSGNNKNNNSDEPTKEAIALTDLRKQLADVSHEDSRLTDDLYLLPWLKNFNFKIPRTAQAIRDAFKSRKENDLESLADQDVDEELFGEMPYFLDSFTKDRMPAMSLSFKHLDKYENDRAMRHIFQFFTKLELLVIIQNRERYYDLCEREGRRMPVAGDVSLGGTIVLDCQKFQFSLRHLPRVIQLCLAVTKTIIKCFPCLLSYVYVVNSNKYFENIFKVLKPIVSLSLPSTTVEILDGNEAKWKPILLQFIDEDAALYLHLKENSTQIMTTKDSAPART